MIYALIGCLIIIGFLGYKLTKKIQIDNEILEKAKQDLAVYNHEVNTQKEILQQQKMELFKIQEQAKTAKEETEYEKYKLDECKKDLQTALNTYQNITDNKLKEIDASIEEQRQKRQIQLDEEFKSKDKYYKKLLEDTYHECEKQSEEIKQAAANIFEEYQAKTELAASKFAGLQNVLKQYEMERQAKLFYTIQLPEEFQDDIEFLLTTVAAKVQHPDIISKLVWAEYVKPNLDNTFKRIEIKSEPGIYKLTSLENGMSYIGKSTDVKKRIADHFKSSIGIHSIADQAVHHAILKEGFWNWSIEVIIYADKDKLNELEKYYIDFFKTQEFGYNKNSGGGG